MPLLWFGTEQQRERWIGRATVGPPSTDFLGRLGGQRARRHGELRPPQPDGRASSSWPTTTRPSGEYVLNGEKHWPCNAGGWDLRGADVNLCIVRTDRTKGGKEALSAVLVERGHARASSTR